MLVERDIQKILNQLAVGNAINVPYDGATIMIKFIEEHSKLALSSLVYQGENYIPASVRRCLSHQPPYFHPAISTSLTLDENHFQVTLNYFGEIESLTTDQFKDILEEFGKIAEKWRAYLDDHDKNDLIYVHVK